MKTYKTRSGPFRERPYYTNEEIDSICTDELRKVGLFPSSPQPIRIERFVEKRFGIVTAYADLPEGLLGFTKFGPKGVEEIIVSRALADEGSKSAERCINTTLAHEAGHGLLHGYLFALEKQSKAQSLFGKGLDQDERKILCRGDTVLGLRDRKGGIGYDGRWWEYQANRVMGGLLLPSSLVSKALQPFMVKRGTLGIGVLSPARREEAIRVLADTFDVNPIVARIRAEELLPAAAERQLTV